ncbi:MAG TPA: Gfo/Idh/MocA family oxidoreductase [Spirochaetia bacterium]|nr:Gfo/Idh/MocA family oxidoreductase [Spirochaetia bacterium]
MSGEPRALRIGIVGSGAMAEYHAEKFSSIPGVSVTACTDRSVDRARNFARRMGIPSWFASTVELAKSGTVDCLSTAQVDSAHARAALDALEHRVPVFAEKPLARTLPEARAMRDCARTAAVPAVVNFSKRNAPALALARALIREGRIGLVRGGSFRYLQSWLLQDAWGRWDTTPRWRWRVSPASSTDGVIGDLGSHLVDTVRFVAGDVREVSCAFTRFTADPDHPGEAGAPDSFAALLRLESGCVMDLRASWRARGHLDDLSFEVDGEGGSLAVDLGRSRVSVQLFDARTAAWTTVAAPKVASTYEQFISELRGSGPPGPGFDEGLESQRVIDACSRSGREGRTVVLGAGTA